MRAIRQIDNIIAQLNKSLGGLSVVREMITDQRLAVNGAINGFDVDLLEVVRALKDAEKLVTEVIDELATLTTPLLDIESMIFEIKNGG